MKIYLAGCYSRIHVMNIYLAGKGGMNHKEKMNIYLAGEHTVKNGKGANWSKLCILESFYYAEKNEHVPKLVKSPKVDFLLDSGAFTFFGNGKTVDWHNYIDRYSNFVNKHNVTKFLELDLDNIIGLNETRKLRKYLEDKTKKKSIPVWRPKRGLEYWKEMCENYDYVAISASGAFDSAWTRGKGAENVLNKMISIAHKNNSKVHGLGYTKLKGLESINWDSVDSTAWLYGNRAGFLYFFNGKTMVKKFKPQGKRLKSKEVAQHNFNEWVKYQQYAKRFL